jgi:hypothetical protein
MGKPNDLVQGTLDLLILRTLANETKHGWAIGPTSTMDKPFIRAKPAGQN